MRRKLESIKEKWKKGHDTARKYGNGALEAMYAFPTLIRKRNGASTPDENFLLAFPGYIIGSMAHIGVLAAYPGLSDASLSSVYGSGLPFALGIPLATNITSMIYESKRARNSNETSKLEEKLQTEQPI